MPPRHQTLPPAQTSSAREARDAFHCDLCNKGYARMNEYEAHLSSYDHSHKQRLKDMKAMVRDPNAGVRARKAEARAEGLKSIKLPGQGQALGAGAGSKKGGFKKTGFKSSFTPVEGGPEAEAMSSNSEARLPPKPTSVQDAPRANASMNPPAGGPASLPAKPPTKLPPKPRLRTGSPVESDTEDEGYEVYDPRFPTD